MIQVHTPALGRDAYLREGTSDRQVWADTFTGLYHVPPGSMPVPGSVLDLGANIGLTLAHYRARWPDAEIVGVEMDSDNAELARRNAPGVTVRVQAVSDRGGVSHYDTTRAAEAYQLCGPQGRMVRANTLRQIILRSFSEWPIDFVKMDVEGSEWPILKRPNWASLVRYLLVELHDPGPNPASSEDLVARAVVLLDQAGFEARHHPPHPQAVWAVRR